MAKASAALAVVTALAWALAATQADTCPLIHLRYGKPFTSRKTVGLSLEVAVHKSQASTVNATNLPVLAVKLPDGFRRVRQDAYPDSPKEAYPLTFDTERTFADRRWTVYARNVLTPTVLKRKIKLKVRGVGEALLRSLTCAPPTASLTPPPGLADGGDVLPGADRDVRCVDLPQQDGWVGRLVFD